MSSQQPAAAPPPPEPARKGAPPAPPAPAPPTRKHSPAATIPQAIIPAFTSGIESGADRVLIYGVGGIGKSTLGAWMPAPAIFDLQNETKHMDVTREHVFDWVELRGKLAGFVQSPTPGARSVVVDNATKAELFASQFVIETRKATRSGAPSIHVESIEDYGWGKGWQYVAEEFEGLLADLDRIAALGFNVCLIAHEVSSPVPNPAGEDWIRWEPRLYAGDRKGKGSIRDRVFEWSDHVLYVGYDVHVEEGKGRGSGTRSIYTQELPTHRAKSRTNPGTFTFTLDNPGAVWSELGVQ